MTNLAQLCLLFDCLRRPSTKARAAAEDCALSASAAELMAVVAESLAKLLLHQSAWLRHYSPSSPAAAAAQDADAAWPAAPDSQQQQARLLQSALALLLQLQFHPATAALTEVCQRLSVFFDVFSAASEGKQLQLAAACLPAARQALHMKVKKHPAPLLAKYVLQLLQQARLRREQAESEGPTSRQGERTSYTSSVLFQLLVLGGVHNFPGSLQPRSCLCSRLHAATRCLPIEGSLEMHANPCMHGDAVDVYCGSSLSSVAHINAYD